LLKTDDIIGYGKQHREKKWWFDLEDVDGILQVPRGNQKIAYKELNPEA
jgi:hypothetical protein